MLAWNGNRENLIDRFDGRALLDFYRDHVPRRVAKSEEELQLEEVFTISAYPLLNSRLPCRSYKFLVASTWAQSVKMRSSCTRPRLRLVGSGRASQIAHIGYMITTLSARRPPATCLCCRWLPLKHTETWSNSFRGVLTTERALKRLSKKTSRLELLAVLLQPLQLQLEQLPTIAEPHPLLLQVQTCCFDPSNAVAGWREINSFVSVLRCYLFPAASFHASHVSMQTADKYRGEI